FWTYPNWGTTNHHPTIGSGELPPSIPTRHEHIYPGRLGPWPNLPPKSFAMQAKAFVDSIVPGHLTRMLGYGPAGGEVHSPGPLFRVDLGQNLIVRVDNAIERDLHLEISVHLHGGHTPAHSDGHPNFMIRPGQARDYYYPNPIPLKVRGELLSGPPPTPPAPPEDIGEATGSKGQPSSATGGAFRPSDNPGPRIEWTPIPGEWDHSEVPSTMWYHDHAEDITAHNALMGLAGIYILQDETERKWIADGILPTSDTPIALRDVCLCPVPEEHMHEDVRAEVQRRGGGYREARIHFDPFDHDGSLGNHVLCNGAVFPVLKLGPGQHRLRLLNASLARMYHLRFVAVGKPGTPQAGVVASTAEGHPHFLPVLRFGKDSWLMPHAVRTQSTFLSMAARADVILDLEQTVKHQGTEWSRDDYDLYLVSTLVQKDGRGPGHGDNEFDLAQPRGSMFDGLDDDVAFGGEGKAWRKPEDPQNVTHDGGPQAGNPNWLWLMRIARDEKAPSSFSSLAPMPASFEAALRDASSSTAPAEPARPTALRQHESILESLKEIKGAQGQIPWEAIPRREFDFERGQGAWKINHQFYDANTSNAVPALWSTELWILRNRSGGWWHPIHIHLESHQQVYVSAKTIKTGTLNGAEIDRVVLAHPDYTPPWLPEGMREEDLRSFLKADPRNYTDAEIDAIPMPERAHLAAWITSFRLGEIGAAVKPSEFTREIVARLRLDPLPKPPPGFDPAVWNLGIKHDTTLLGPNTEVHVLMRFRTFQGPFVFHCHNLNHEDMRMMFQFDPRIAEHHEDWRGRTEIPVRPAFWFYDQKPHGGAR
ncbi:MAG: multicopper oxidase domain-containing protein, partial [Planctomycetota bacterium]